ncbi:dolichyl-phosphate beta-glucosyltransferase [Dimargaris cristalligena]|uniref:dolichyl-phosphate beta-glucosyltransferase n=1 Tax=Dimargaris cristalligena TaxID=215637 RepID=A0A4P9ZQM4_9FUNG|nr:dolichyl-phosphate beta-glucosyltransferase [Dimargaris cristalligena]|eukprot:RKP35418.1 dolichyl-phosphate beta-glucosyltransferase [Dimargaris cristalligena]
MDSLPSPVYGALTLLAGFIFICVGFMFTFLTLISPKTHPLTDEEKYYRDTISDTPHPLPSLFDTPTVTLSVVVPAYNESQRLPKMLEEARDYLEALILLVDDGSRDQTTQVALDYAREHNVPNLRVLTFSLNRGKGGAVTQGFLHARGRYILFADADGATSFPDLSKLMDGIQKVTRSEMGVAVGSRAHLKDPGVIVKRSIIRRFLMRAFHAFVYIFGIREVEDTQCGFKLFTRRAAQAIFPNIHVERWIFDIEVLLLATNFRIPVVEVPVTWHEVAGSKMHLMRDSIIMAADLLLLRLNYVFGVWKATPIDIMHDRRGSMLTKTN